MFHDSNAFHALNNISINLNIIVINNKGGQIFSRLPYAKKNLKQFTKYWITPPYAKLKDLAKLFKLKYYKLSNLQLYKTIEKIASISGVKIIEIPVDSNHDIKENSAIKKAIAKSLN